MAYVNVYPSRINWENEPSINTPINAVNLNKIDYAVYEHDQTLANWDTTKANQSDLLLCVKTITYDTDTGVFVFTWQNGTSQTVDLNIEKIPVSFSMDANGVITMTTEDGTQYTADVGSLIKTYTFTDSGRIDFSVTTDASGNKTVVADIIDGSITGAKLQPNYLADCQAAQTGAETAQGLSEDSAEDAEAWAVGQRNGSDVPSTDPTYHNNAKYWAEHTSSSFAGLTDTSINDPQNGQVPVYNSTTQKWENQNAPSSVEIDDSTTALNKVWSSQKVNTELSAKLPQSVYAKSGAVNYLNSVAVTTTSSGVVFTVDSDKRITANNQATGTAYCTILNGVTFKAGTYKLRGCPANGADDKYYIKIFGPNSVVIATDYGEGASFTLSADTVLYIYAYVTNGYTANNLVFEPMITEPDYTGPYAPYAKTNKELTSDTTATEEAFTPNTSIVSSSSALKLYRIGKLLTFNGYIITNNGVGSQNDTILTLTNARPVSGAVTYVQLLDSSGNLYLAKLNSNGTITLDSASLPKAGYSVIGTILTQ